MVSSVEQKIISWLQKSLLLCLLVYCAWLSSQLVWFALEGNNIGVISLSERVNKVVSQRSPHASKVSDFHLFGEAGLIQVKKQDTPKVAPKTRLRLILKGVFTAEQSGESGAIVEEIGKSADYYRLGDTLPGNATLEEVYSDRIILRRNGRLETLSFEEKPQTQQNRIAKAVSAAKKTESPRITTPEQFIEEATQRLSEDPDRAIRSVGLAPSEDGGYVYQGGNPMLSGLNLNKGDIIRSVNGHPLGDIRKDKSLMKSLYEQGNLEVEVVRDGASFYVNYPLR